MPSSISSCACSTSPATSLPWSSACSARSAGRARVKYWPDEPGADAMTYWTESHYLLFSAAGYLAGQLYPEMVFTNSSASAAVSCQDCTVSSSFNG